MEDERIKGFDVCFSKRIERERERERERELLYKTALGPQFYLFNFFFSIWEQRGFYILVCDTVSSGVHFVYAHKFRAHT